MQVQFEKIPPFLKSYDQFCNWKYELRKACPAYRLNIDCPDREMTLDELAVCVRSIREFLDGILICTEEGKKPAYVHPCIRSFEDSFAEDH